MENLNKVVADNLVYYRKSAGLTQIELAEKINYSDKAVSKWERGESIPDLPILVALAEIYGVTVNDFLVIKHQTSGLGKQIKKSLKNKKVLITLLSCCAVWLFATIAFVLSFLLDIHISQSWILFIYAIPASFLVAFILACVWGPIELYATLLSITVWTTFVGIYLTLGGENWLMFFIAIPIQIAIVIWVFLDKQVVKLKLTKKEVIKNSRIEKPEKVEKVEKNKIEKVEKQKSL